MTPGRAWGRAGLVLGAVVAADQLTKALVTSALDRGEEDPFFIGVKLVNVRNTGVAFGVLEDGGTIVAIVIAVAIAALLAYFARHARRPWMWLPTGLLLGGALGNAIDRIREGAVIDFLKIPLWPAFNLADVAITVGVLALLLVIEHAAQHPDDDAARRPA